jgi:hypothetical protein
MFLLTIGGAQKIMLSMSAWSSLQVHRMVVIGIKSNSEKATDLATAAISEKEERTKN